MQIVIDIDELAYLGCKTRETIGDITGINITKAIEAIANGTPLPKGHGDLKDVNDMYARCKDGDEWDDYAEYIFESAPTIIKADMDWISIDERVPEELFTVVLVSAVDEIGVPFTQVGTWNSADGKFEDVTGEVKAWMPLPTPPKKEVEK